MAVFTLLRQVHESGKQEDEGISLGGASQSSLQMFERRATARAADSLGPLFLLTSVAHRGSRLERHECQLRRLFAMDALVRALLYGGAGRLSDSKRAGWPTAVGR